MKPTGKQVAQAAQAAVSAGYTYAEMDCQAFVEHCVKQSGGEMDYRGSNDMARNAAWLGTIENAKAEGKLLPGCLLLIHEETDENLPERYCGDGMGDFSHVGLYLGEEFPFEAAHSSQSRGGTAESTLKNGWTHVALAKEVEYGIMLDDFGLVGDETDVPSAEGLTAGTHPGTLSKYAIVASGNGCPVKLRKSASANEPIYWKVYNGARVQVERTKAGWSLIRAICTDGHVRRAYMMSRYLRNEE